MDALNCTYDDYQKAAGFSALDTLAKTHPRSKEFFRIENGGMHLPGIRRAIRADSCLDKFVVNEFAKFANPRTRLFGENTFTVTCPANNYRPGHLERYCGPTLKMKVSLRDGVRR